MNSFIRMQEKVYGYLENHQGIGGTMGEIMLACELDSEQVLTQLNVLFLMGQICDGGQRRFRTKEPVWETVGI